MQEDEVRVTSAHQKAASRLLLGKKVAGGDGQTYVVRTPSIREATEAFARFEQEVLERHRQQPAPDGLADAATQLCYKAGNLMVALDGQEQYRNLRQDVLDQMKRVEAALQSTTEQSARVAELESENSTLRRKTTGRYMIDALVQMLGPKALQVWRHWQAQGVERFHASWGPDAVNLDGEGRAQVILDMEAASRNAEPITDVDAALNRSKQP